MQHFSETCFNCGTDSKSRRRDFSEQAWTVLVLWSEVQAAAVDQPICEECYGDLRETLIDRADEIEVALTEPAQPRKTAQPAAAKRPAVAKQKVRKAG